ncbi:MAG: RluA family pseudouridine synthase [Prevotella sp.]|nr:RluA family pseudouridine synthase [Prevotella sp.]
MKFHPLKADGVQRPFRFNSPFDYEPDALSLSAVAALQAELPARPAEGKMYGVLIVERGGQMGYLQAYSGQMEDGTEDFVPAVFDYLQPVGYFKTHEAEITQLNLQIARLKTSEAYRKARERLTAVSKEAELAIGQRRTVMQAAKLLRDQRRREAFISEQEREEMTRQSQFLKAELHRVKVACAGKVDAARRILQGYEDRIAGWKRERKLKSDRLQRWLFSQFSLLNARGERKSLLDIFRDYYLANSPARSRVAHVGATFSSQSGVDGTSAALLPPSGAGECCEPKLLQYAFRHGYKPVSMAMFWWGPSPKAEIRQHGNFYPACNGKCRPILTWMMQGLETEAAGEKGAVRSVPPGKKAMLEVIYEDAYLAVVSKPPGLLSVPGRSDRPSVYSLLRTRWAGSGEPLMVHRLDMDTSGLLVVARTPAVHKSLQAQFAAWEVRKEYVALLPLSFLDRHLPAEGRIELPLRPDADDRPRQLVDPVGGKPAVTEYHVIGCVAYGAGRQKAVRLELRPLTGRTHQLRVHCAHPDGLGTPILGDALYGNRADRLWLHAGHLELTHPVTGERMTFDCPLEL